MAEDEAISSSSDQVPQEEAMVDLNPSVESSQPVTAGVKRSLPEFEPLSPGDTPASPRKKTKIEEDNITAVATSDASKQTEPDEGEIADTNGSSLEFSSQNDKSVSGPAAKAHNGWNNGVSSGLRTSFPSLKKGKTLLKVQSQPQAQPESAPETKSSPRDESQPQLEASAGSPAPNEEAEEAVEVTSEEKTKDAEIDIDMGNLVFPVGYPNYNSSNGKSAARARSWNSKFRNWCINLMSLNKDRAEVQNPAFLKAAWSRWLQGRGHMDALSRTTAVQAAEKFDFGQINDMISTALTSAPESPASTTTADSTQSATAPKAKDAENESTSDGQKAEISDGGYVLPPLPAASNMPKKLDNAKAWEAVFVSWCRSLTQSNQKKPAVKSNKDRNRLHDFYNRCLGASDLAKKQRSAARLAARNFLDNKTQQAQALFSDPSSSKQTQASAKLPARPPVKSSSSAENAVEASSAQPDVDDADAPTTNPVPLTEGELAYRDRYFPGLPVDAVFCVVCASARHNSADCPEMTCQFCKDSHPSWTCPTRRRCTKCKQLGHSQTQCVEKLMLSKDEMECALCGSQQHDDFQCTKLLKSFRPNMARFRKVQSLPVFCHACGLEGHYGADCGLLNAQKPKANALETWSQANAAQYTDPNSTELAIAYQTPPEVVYDTKAVETRPDLGKSIVPRQHIHFESADDDEDEFIQPLVSRNTRPAQKITMGFNQSNQQNEGRSHALPARPPLPSGPPPSFHGFHQENDGRGGGGGGGGRGNAGGGSGGRRR
ncbi:hypothetical protein QBC35DRAFT_403369, partial [Podospora australis]